MIFNFFGRDQLYGHSNKPLKLFRGLYIWKQSKILKQDEEYSIRDAQKIADRNSFLSASGFKNFK